MHSVNEIRSTFLDYFRRNGHEIVASSPLVPRNDPTLMFVNAGMVQFKNVFTGFEQRKSKRATTSQKCVRAGGKHNDLDNVGYTARHHTFFEMLGNFSFGDYFKEDAIYFAWNLLTKDFGLSKDKLLVTVYHDDHEAADLWKKIAGFSDSKIIKIASNDNFWAMGDVGPCGPCSEIFYDHGDKIAGGPPGSADEDGDRFIEIWNLVFMQFEQLAPDKRVALPKPSIDTGMGLERIAAVLQGVHDNYDIDLFKTLIHASEELTGVRSTGEFIASHRVIADHLRSSAFLIADGVLPSNEGRGYVLRRIMRRAMRHVQLLGAKEPLMWRLLPTLVAEMGQAYPELYRAQPIIAETLKLEETRFRKTLERGLGLLNDATASLQRGDELDGAVAFKLYDTYGFPLDLTQDALRRRGISVDILGFDSAMEKQKSEARKSWLGSGEDATEGVWFAVREKTGTSEFLGYDAEKAEGMITSIVYDAEIVNHVDAGKECWLIANQTPFYAESGGQIGDTGVIKSDSFLFEVSDTKKKADGLICHFGRLCTGTIEIGNHAQFIVDSDRRRKIRANHSATHLLHEALRQVLGNHVVQKGSLVAPDRLRFDFSHPKAISRIELDQVEDLANEIILQNNEVTTCLMAADDAINSGAMALFGEKYGEEVRVVSMGTPTDLTKNRAWSVELCGGTHVQRTGDIGIIRIVAESSVAAGVRRVEALTGDTARHYLVAQDERIHQIAGILKTSTDESVERVKSISEERRKLERELAELRRDQAYKGDGGSIEEPEQINNVTFLARILSGVDARDLKPMVDASKKHIKSGIVVLITVADDNKASVVIGVTNDLTEKFNAVDLVRMAANELGGQGGGGRPDMAQAGGAYGERASGAIAAIKQLIMENN